MYQCDKCRQWISDYVCPECAALSCSAPATGYVPLANEEQKRLGWSFDCKILREISEASSDADFSVGMEEAETVLKILLAKGYIEAHNVTCDLRLHGKEKHEETE